MNSLVHTSLMSTYPVDELPVVVTFPLVEMPVVVFVDPDMRKAAQDD